MEETAKLEKIWKIKRKNACAFPTCTLRDREAFFQENKFLSQHTFPKGAYRKSQREKWIHFVRESRQDLTWTPTDNSIICSRHFAVEHYGRRGGQFYKMLLFTNAVPYFNLPSHVNLPPHVSSLKPITPGNIALSTLPAPAVTTCTSVTSCIVESEKIIPVSISEILNHDTESKIPTTTTESKKPDESVKPNEWRNELEETETEDLKIEEMEVDDVECVGIVSYPLIVQVPDADEVNTQNLDDVLEEEVPLYDPLALPDDNNDVDANSIEKASPAPAQVLMTNNAGRKETEKMVLSCLKCCAEYHLTTEEQNKINKSKIPLNKLTYFCRKCSVRSLSSENEVNVMSKEPQDAIIECSSTAPKSSPALQLIDLLPSQAQRLSPTSPRPEPEPLDKNGQPLMVKCIATFCKEKFYEWSVRFTTHLATHYPAYDEWKKKRFPCRFCTRTVSKPYRIRVHELVDHKEMLTHSCHICDQQYSTEELLDSHVMIHLPKGPFTCLICREVFKSPETFDEHLLLHIPIPKKEIKKIPQNCKSVATQAAIVRKTVEELSGIDDEDLGVALDMVVEPLVPECSHSETTETECRVSEPEEPKHILNNSKSVATQSALVNKLVKAFVVARACEKGLGKSIDIDDVKPPATETKNKTNPTATGLRNSTRNANARFICYICGNESPNSEAYLKHHSLHKKSTPKTFKCELCIFPKFRTGHSLISHILSAHESKGDEENPETKPFSCTKCPKRFVTRFMFQRHMNFHNLDNKKRLSCQICDLRFYKRETKQLQLHIKTRHSTKSKYIYTCQKCDKVFGNNFTRKRHERISHPEIFIHECTECKVKYSEESILKTHYLALHSSEEGPYKCFACTIRKKPFSTKDELRIHLRSHTGESYVECPKCSEEFDNISILNNHMEEKHSEEIDKVEGDIESRCPICEKPYYSQHRLDLHIAEAHPEGQNNLAVYKGMYGYFKCHFCDDVFTHKKYRTRHIYRNHEKRHWTQCHICGKGMTNDLLKPHLRRHKGIDCIKCRKVFATPAELKEHMKEAHNVSGEPPPETTVKSIRIKNPSGRRKILIGRQQRKKRKRLTPSFPCPLCSQVSCSLHLLNRHLRLVHHEGQQPNDFDCYICGKKFVKQIYVRKHILRCHELRSARQCEICGKRLMSKENYDLHIKAHKNERNFVCYFCKKRFLDKPTLFNHLMVHTVEKPYKCGVCDQTFRLASGRKSHMRRIHEKNHCPNDSYVKKLDTTGYTVNTNTSTSAV